MASTSVLLLTVKVDLTDVAGCKASPSLTTLVVSPNEKKTTVQTVGLPSGQDFFDVRN